jgi:NAD(P)H-dependent FMN reductase
MLTIISSSLGAESNSRLLAAYASVYAKTAGIEGQLIDLREYPLALCDGHDSYSNPNVERLSSTLRTSSSLLIAAPIYNYDVSAALKNVIEHVGGEFTDKVVGMMCAAGGNNSFMSPLPFLNSLMLDFRSIIVPRFVYASRDSFADGTIQDAKIKERIEELVIQTHRLGRALS